MRHPDCQTPIGNDYHVEETMAQQQGNPGQGVTSEERDRKEGRETPNQQNERDNKERYDPSEAERGRDNQDDNRQNESDRSQTGSRRD